MAELRGCDFPDTLRYHPESHLWFAESSDGHFDVGITAFGVALVGEILMFSAKPPGAEIDAGRAFGLLEACKTVFPVKTPFAARLLAGNDSLLGSGAALQTLPYGTWLVRLQPDDPAAALATLCEGPAAWRAIEAQMDLYGFDHLAAFAPRDGR